MEDSFRYELIAPGAPVLCALSGGADSMYLLCRLLEGAERGGYTVRAAHYNHGLRASAGRDEAFVRAWCESHGVPLAVETGAVADRAAALGQGLEETARQMRYDFLERAAQAGGCGLIATGHQAGDDAETVLMNLIRGSGLRGLTGIPERRGKLIRPMLAVTRREIEQYLEEHGVPHVEDETNSAPECTRNRVRLQLIPMLEELNPRAVEHIAAAARRLRADEAELERQAAGLLERAGGADGPVEIQAAQLSAAPRPVAVRACRRLLERAGLAVGALQLERVLALAESGAPSARLDLPGGQVRREYGRLVFGPAPDPGPPARPLREGENRWGSWRAVCAQDFCPPKAYIGPCEFYLRPERYELRQRRTGDALELGRRRRKTVKKLLIEGKVPAARRAGVPVLACEGQAAALGGFGPDKHYLAQPGQLSLHIILIEERET